MVGSEKKGRGIWKNHLYEVDRFEAEDMMGEIESVRVSEVAVPTEKLNEMVAVVVPGKYREQRECELYRFCLHCCAERLGLDLSRE